MILEDANNTSTEHGAVRNPVQIVIGAYERTSLVISVISESYAIGVVCDWNRMQIEWRLEITYQRPQVPNEN